VDTRINPVYLTDSKYATFARYVKSASIFKCPSDQQTVGPRKTPTTYSYAMNGFMSPVGIVSNIVHSNPRFRVYYKGTQVDKPADRFVFIDGNPQSICCPAFMVDPPPAGTFFHLPGMFHNKGGVVSFADGHAARHAWIDPRTARSISGDGLFQVAHISSSGNPDLLWLQDHATGPK
jgi:prepilin-type processing-associated H-X9-DG protein